MECAIWKATFNSQLLIATADGDYEAMAGVSLQKALQVQPLVRSQWASVRDRQNSLHRVRLSCRRLHDTPADALNAVLTLSATWGQQDTEANLEIEMTLTGAGGKWTFASAALAGSEHNQLKFPEGGRWTEHRWEFAAKALTQNTAPSP